MEHLLKSGSQGSCSPSLTSGEISVWTLFSALQSVTLCEPFSPLRLSRGCNGFCNQKSSRKKKKANNNKKLKQNQTAVMMTSLPYVPVLLLCVHQLHVLFVVPWLLPVLELLRV